MKIIKQSERHKLLINEKPIAAAKINIDLWTSECKSGARNIKGTQV